MWPLPHHAGDQLPADHPVGALAAVYGRERTEQAINVRSPIVPGRSDDESSGAAGAEPKLVITRLVRRRPYAAGTAPMR